MRCSRSQLHADARADARATSAVSLTPAATVRCTASRADGAVEVPRSLGVDSSRLAQWRSTRRTGSAQIVTHSHRDRQGLLTSPSLKSSVGAARPASPATPTELQNAAAPRAGRRRRAEDQRPRCVEHESSREVSKRRRTRLTMRPGEGGTEIALDGLRTRDSGTARAFADLAAVVLPVDHVVQVAVPPPERPALVVWEPTPPLTAIGASRVARSDRPVETSHQQTQEAIIVAGLQALPGVRTSAERRPSRRPAHGVRQPIDNRRARNLSEVVATATNRSRIRVFATASSREAPALLVPSSAVSPENDGRPGVPDGVGHCEHEAAVGTKDIGMMSKTSRR